MSAEQFIGGANLVRPALILTISAAVFITVASSGSAQEVEAGSPTAAHGAISAVKPTATDIQDNYSSKDVPLKRMIAQMIIIAQRGEDSSGKWHRRVFKLLGDGRLGGVKLTGQGLDPVQLKAFTSSLRSSGGLAPFIGIDHQTLSTAAGPYRVPCARDVGN